MIGILVSILLASRFFKIAKKVGQNPWGWAIVGLFSFLIISNIWALVLGLILFGAGIQLDGTTLNLLLSLTGLLVGAIGANFLGSKIIVQPNQETKKIKLLIKVLSFSYFLIAWGIYMYVIDHFLMKMQGLPLIP